MLACGSPMPTDCGGWISLLLACNLGDQTSSSFIAQRPEWLYKFPKNTQQGLDQNLCYQGTSISA
jgi:hypothetical protein